MGFSSENIHENESTRTLLAKASKLNMYIHNIHLHIFSLKLISPVIAVYKQTVFPISLNCPTIPYKNFAFLFSLSLKEIFAIFLDCPYKSLYTSASRSVFRLPRVTARGVSCPKFLAMRPRRKTCCFGAVMSVKVGVTVDTSFDCLEFYVSVSMEIAVVTKSVQK